MPRWSTPGRWCPACATSPGCRRRSSPPTSVPHVTDACTPTAEDFIALAQTGNLVPVYREILADTETPVSAYLKIARGPHGFLLESVQGGEKWARYSFLGSEPAAIFS